MTAVNASAPRTPPLVTQQPAALAWIGSGDAGAPAEIGQGSAAPVPPKDIREASTESQPSPKPSPEQAAKNLAHAEAALRDAESIWGAQKSEIEENLKAKLIEINNDPTVQGISLRRQIEDAEEAANRAISDAQRPVELLRSSVDAMRDPHKKILEGAKARSDQAKARLVEARAAAQIAYDEATKADEDYRAELANGPESILDFRDFPPVL